ncbi:MAG: leucine-rich repeat domain-containing protein [Bacteroides sp.]|nr:leucine-rich repeat domain-containing protein [Bacteroides sp.]
MNYRILISAILILFGYLAQAHDFSATVSGQPLYFNITDKSKHTVEVTFKGNAANQEICTNKGVVEIPHSVKHSNVIYSVTGIGVKAFANAKELTGITIPSGVTSIGDFAFEGCTALNSVVFPGNPVKLGEGIFFRCTSISNITFGSDWKTIDLAAFRWSKALDNVSIPAKTEKIQGLKKLKTLKSITVDPNNKFFSSADGMLFSKDRKTLYACPRGYAGRLNVPDGVEKVLQGALIDCPDIISIVFPSSLISVSFRETSRMKKLETIVMKNDTPIITGYIGDMGKFLFQCANTVDILVASKVKNAYVELLATEAGEYCDAPGKIRYLVTASELPTKNNIKGEKNFNNY